MSGAEGTPSRGDAAVFLSAGEASGDQHGAAVAREIRKRAPEVRLFGLGGPRMAAAGVELLAGLDRLAVMGYREVLARLPFFLSLKRRVHRLIREQDVRLVIPVDYPGFNLPLARRAHDDGRRVLYFISPQVWAWKPRRAATLARCCDRVLTILPFERQWLEPYGVAAEFVGHPLLDSVPERTEEPTESVVGLFPGSRAQEVERMLPIFAEAADLLRSERPELGFVIARPPSLPAALYEDHAPGLETAEAEAVRRRATAAMTKSGTITLELALTGIPMVVGYRTGPLTFALARRLVKVPSIALANLVAGDRIVPELVQDELTPAALAAAVEPLLDARSPSRLEMRAALARVRRRLGEPGCASRVAEHALELLG